MDTERAADLDDLLAELAATDDRYRYSVAWIDLLARGAQTGPRRSSPAATTPRSTHCRPRPAATRSPSAPRRCPPRPRLSPSGLLGRTTGRAVQRVLVPQGPARAARPAPAAVRVLPPAGRAAGVEPGLRPRRLRAVPVRGRLRRRRTRCARIVRRMSRARLPVLPRRAQAFRRGRPRLAVLPDAGLDPGPGHSRRTARASARCWTSWTRRSLAAGGRVYLAKDSRLRPELMARMYPRLDDFRTLRARTTRAAPSRPTWPAGWTCRAPSSPSGARGPPVRPLPVPMSRPRPDRPSPPGARVKDAFGAPQSLLVLGGTSEIALATARRLIARRTRTVHLAGPPLPARWTPPRSSCARWAPTCTSCAFDAARPGVARGSPRQGLRRGRHRRGAARLRRPRRPGRGRAGAAAPRAVAHVNYTGAVSAASWSAPRPCRSRATASLVVLSSVAGERARRAELHLRLPRPASTPSPRAWATACTAPACTSWSVRPGFVRHEDDRRAGGGAAGHHAGRRRRRDRAPGCGARGETVWVPGALRYVMSGLRHVPRPLFRKLPL